MQWQVSSHCFRKRGGILSVQKTIDKSLKNKMHRGPLRLINHPTRGRRY